MIKILVDRVYLEDIDKEIEYHVISYIDDDGMFLVNVINRFYNYDGSIGYFVEDLLENNEFDSIEDLFDSSVYYITIDELLNDLHNDIYYKSFEE